MARRVAALACVTLIAVAMAAGPARASIVVSVASPSGGAYASPLPIEVNVISTYDVASVHAQVGALGVDLTPVGVPTWTGLLPITSLPYGPGTAVITATDVFGTTATMQATFVHDEPPTIAITAPALNAVARPTLHLAATCADDAPAGCTALTVSSGPQLLATGGASVVADVDLAGFDGQAITLRFAAADATGRQTIVDRRVYVEASPALVEVATLGAQVLDIDDTRILYADATGAVRIYRRSDGQDVAIGTLRSDGDVAPVGHLTSVGAAWVSMLGAAGSCAQARALYEWHGTGAAILVDQRCAGVDLPWTLVGDHAAVLSGGAGGDVIRRDLTTGTVVTFTFPAGVSGGMPLPFAGTWLAPGGDVFGGAVDVIAAPAVPGVRFYRYRAGAITEIAQSLEPSTWGVMGDGETLLYLTGNATSVQTRVQVPPAAEQVLSVGLADVRPGTGYAVAGGWVAFLRASPSTGVRQVWRRSPAGVEQVIAPFATDSAIDTLAPAGDLTVVNAGARYLGVGGAPPALVGSALGRAVFLSDGLYVVLGRMVLRYQPAVVAVDAGVVDGGANDAGVIDGGPTDASLADGSPAPDAAGGPDAAGSIDAGRDASTPGGDARDGCGCAAGHAAPRASAAMAFVVLAVVSRRRRRPGR